MVSASALSTAAFGKTHAPHLHRAAAKPVMQHSAPGAKGARATLHPNHAGGSRRGPHSGEPASMQRDGRDAAAGGKESPIVKMLNDALELMKAINEPSVRPQDLPPNREAPQMHGTQMKDTAAARSRVDVTV